MNKILIIGPDFFSYNEAVGRVFEDQGYEVKIFDYSNLKLSGFKKRILIDLLYDRFGISSFYNKVLSDFNSLLLDLFYEYKPSITFVIKGDKILGSTLIKMKDTIKILWMMDSISVDVRQKSVGVELTKKNLLNYDYKFFFEKTDLNKLSLQEKNNSYFLPLAFEERIYKKSNDPIDKNIDVLFVGNLSNERVAIFNKVLKTFPDKKIEIFGKYLGFFSFRRFFLFYFKKYKKYYMNKNLSPREVNLMYSQAKICINLHKKQSEKGCNPRFFEISGNGSFQIVDYNHYIYENYIEDEDFVSFKNIDDLIQKIDFYLKDDTRRSIISKNIYEKVIKNHKFSDRISFILTKIGEKETFNLK